MLAHFALCEDHKTKLSADAAPAAGYNITASVHPPCSIIFGYTGTGNYYSLTISGHTLAVVRTWSGSAAPVCSHTFGPGQKIREFSLLFKQRNKNVYVYKDGLLLVSQEIRSLKRGRYGYRGNVEHFRIHEAIRPFCSDDFEREGSSPAWTREKGTWNISTVPNPSLSVSPYQYAGTGSPAISVTGKTLWDDYMVSVSMLPGNPGTEAGLVCYYQNPGRFYSCTWKNSTLELRREYGGKTDLLFTQKIRISPGSWHRLAVLCFSDSISVYIDGVNVCSDIRNTLGWGKAGVYARSPSPVYFDDVTVLPSEYMPDTSEAVLPCPDKPVIPEEFIDDGHMASWVHAPALRTGSLYRDYFDFTFFRQPVNWEFGRGEWGIYSRWSCKPRYTWFSGIPSGGERAGVLWLRRKIEGDCTIKLFAAVKMEERGMPFYDFPCNINCTFSARPGAYADDITFSFGGPDIPSRIFRGTETAAESSSEVIPGIRRNYDAIMKTFHRDWFEVTFRRYANRYSILSGTTVLASCTVDDTAERPFVCIWNADTGISAARIQIAAEQSGLLDKQELEAMSRKNPVPDRMVEHLFSGFEDLHKTRNLLTRSSGIPREYPEPKAHDFFHKPVFVRPLVPQPPFMYDDALVFRENSGYRIVNAHLGGTGEVTLCSHRFLPASYPEIAFEYNLSQDLRLCLTVYLENGHILRHPLTLETDGAWHDYSTDLDTRLAGMQSPITEISIKHRYPRFMLQGDSYLIRNVFLVPAVPGNRDSFPAELPNGARLSRGNSTIIYRSGTTENRFPVSFTNGCEKEPGLIHGYSPAIEMSGTSVVVRLHEQVRKHIDPSTVLLCADGTEYRFHDSDIQFNTEKGTVSLDLEKAGFTALKKNSDITFRVYSYSGKKLTSSRTVTVPDDSRAPRVLSAYPLYEKRLVYEPFTHRSPGFFDPLLPSNHRRGRVRYIPGKNPCIAFAAPFSKKGTAFLVRQQFNFRTYPLLIMRYKCRQQAGFRISAQKDNRFISLYSVDNADPSEWETLLLHLPLRFSNTNRSSIDYLFMTVYANHSRRDAVFADDLQLASPDSKHVDIHLTCSEDISGIKGYSWVMDSAPGTLPREAINLKEDTVRVEHTPAWFHVRACDGKGNWSDVKHLRIH